MNIKIFVKNWLLPPIFYSNGIYLYKKMLIYFNNRNLKKVNFENGLNSFKNKYIGERCFILATGPSIKNQDLSLLKGEKCIAVSMFHMHELINTIRPIWHVFAPSHYPFKFDVSNKIFETCYNAYKENYDIQFWIGHRNYKYSHKEYFKLSKSQFYTRFIENIHWVDYSHSESLSEKNKNNHRVWDPTIEPFEIRTVIYSAIQLAYYLGFKDIILLGCDHDYLNDISRIENHHFYDDSHGFSDRSHLNSFTKEKWFKEYYYRWKEYRLMNEYLATKNVKVLNATEGGMLDVFPRISFNNLFDN